ncbi:unnamed protein product [Miscanthus lutarioriparius]|uniref:Uncharacterized protein n=1 Tax=Miscanthus lutarioriparius TaxID=422564 RepID=A0A811RYP5_9POAL|nr:unnamed protein product [Miscanthus lutarioriparius]
MARLGDPETRPDEDECLIPTSFATEASRREWEETAAVSWAMSGPPNTGPREVEAAIRDEFRLRQGEVPARAFEEFPHHPPPPRRTDKEEPRTRWPDSRSSKGTKGRYNNDHPDFYKGRGKRHDDDDDYDTYGRGGRDDPGRYGRGDHSGAGGYRERDRSPPRRLWAHGSRHGGRQRAPDALEHAVVQPTELLLPAKLPQVSVLQVTEEAELQRLFKAHAMALQGAMQRIMDRAGVQHTGEMASSLKSLMQDYIDKASALAEGLGLLQGPPEVARLDLHEAGNEARKLMAPLLQQPQHVAATMPTPASGGARRRRRQRAFDMSAVRRSARLANARPMSQMQRAQRNLCQKLGLLHDDLEPVETALQDYIAMFNGPLPMDIIAALTEMFNLGTEEPNEVDDALLRMVGEGVEELRDAAILTAAA